MYHTNLLIMYVVLTAIVISLYSTRRIWYRLFHSSGTSQNVLVLIQHSSDFWRWMLLPLTLLPAEHVNSLDLCLEDNQDDVVDVLKSIDSHESHGM